MSELFDDPRWDTFGLLKESFLAAQAAITVDVSTSNQSDQPIRPELRDMLIRLARSDGHHLRPGTLSNDLCISPSSMTRMIDQAEALAYITRKPDPQDRRAHLAALTDAGLSETTSWASNHLESSVTHTRDHLTQAETTTLESLLRRIRDNAQQYVQQHDSK